MFFLFPGVSSPRRSVLPHNSHPESWGPSSHFLPGRRLGPQLGRSCVCGAKLRPDPSTVSPSPHRQNYPFRRESQAGLQRQLQAEWDQNHKGNVVKLAEVTEFGLFLLMECVFFLFSSGTEGHQRCGSCLCGSRGGRQLVFPTNCGLLAVAALPPDPEPESPPFAVSLQSSFNPGRSAIFLG